MFPHPLDCTKFLNCNNGITNVQDCGPGTAWNAKLEVCDFIKNVDCSKNSRRNPNAPTGYKMNSHCVVVKGKRRGCLIYSILILSNFFKIILKFETQAK